MLNCDTEKLYDRLNQILPKITGDSFLKGKGLGNEIAFYIFDYPPECELEVRKHIELLVEQVPRQKNGVRITHVNLFHLIVDYLNEKNLLEKSYEMQKTKGNAQLLKALRGTLNEEKIAKKIVEFAKPEENEIIFISGVGASYPLLRSHTLLNNLHSLTGESTVIMFYPGHFDKVSLRLFGKTGLLGDVKDENKKSVNYYRAFKLVE